MKDTNNNKTPGDIKVALDVLMTKVDLLTHFNEERIKDLHTEMRDLKIEIHKLVTDHEHRVKNLEHTQHYVRGVIGFALILTGIAGSALFRHFLGL